MLKPLSENSTLISGKLLLLLLVVLFVIIMLVPLNITVMPAWRIRIVDELGEPVRGITVREHWQHYAVEEHGHEAELQTDRNGYVVFPERTIKTNALSFVFGAIGNLLENPVHGDGFSPHAYIVVLAWDRGFENGGASLADPLPSQVVLRRRAR